MHYHKSNIVLLMVIILMPVFSTGNLLGQSLAGTWAESKYNVKMILSADGTYTLQYPNGHSRGRYVLNGQTFCMQDASGTNGALLFYSFGSSSSITFPVVKDFN
jgi:hypothetical protein